MSDEHTAGPDPEQPGSAFEEASAPGGGILRDLLGMLARTKKWWLLPIIIALLLVGVLVLLGGTVLAPFLYPLF